MARESSHLSESLPIRRSHRPLSAVPDTWACTSCRLVWPRGGFHSRVSKRSVVTVLKTSHRSTAAHASVHCLFLSRASIPSPVYLLYQTPCSRALRCRLKSYSLPARVRRLLFRAFASELGTRHGLHSLPRWPQDLLRRCWLCRRSGTFIIALWSLLLTIAYLSQPRRSFHQSIKYGLQTCFTQPAK